MVKRKIQEELGKMIEKFEEEAQKHLQSEEALRASEENYREIFNASQDALLIHDPKTGSIVDVNQIACEMLKYSHEDLIKGALGFLSSGESPYTQEEALRWIRKASSEGPQTFEWLAKDSENKLFWVEVNLKRCVIRGNERILAAFRDITKRKQAEEALQRSEKEKTILNEIANIFLTVPDEAMYEDVLAVVLRVMRSTYGIFGFIGDQGELIIPSLTRGIWNECQVSNKSLVFPSDSWGNSIWGRAIREKKVFYSDGPFRTPEGHIHIDCFLTVPIVFGQEGIGLLSVANKEGGYTEEDKNLLERIANNISPILNARLQRDRLEEERKKTEKELWENEKKYRSLYQEFEGLLDAIPDNIALVSPELKFIWINKDAVVVINKTLPNIIGQYCYQVRHNRTEPCEGCPVQRSLQSKKPETEEIITDDGIFVDIRAVPIIDEQGEVKGIIEVARNITERRRAEQQMTFLQAQLLQSQKMEAIGQLAGGVAHDFNNLLTVISVQCQLSLRTLQKDDPVKEKIKDIERAAERAASLTRQLLAFSRRQILEMKASDLNSILENLEKMLHRVIGENIELKTVLTDDLGLVKVDPGQIEQVIVNLALNAKDAMPQGGKLFLETANVELDAWYGLSHMGMIPGAYVLLSVTDTGIGMTKEVKEQIFDPFFTTKEKGKGTGLGLSTVYGIVRQSGGDIYVYSEPNKGTTFKIYFPRVFEPREEFKKEGEEKELPRGTETIFVVEDDEKVRTLAVDLLGKQGYTVLEATEGKEALLICEKHTKPIHLILSDIVMPNMSGPQLIEWLKQVRNDFKVLYMTGYTNEVIVHHGILEKGVNLINKPFAVENLARKVREVLDKN